MFTYIWVKTDLSAMHPCLTHIAEYVYVYIYTYSYVDEHLYVYTKISLSSELMVQIKLKGVIGVENPSPRRFSSGLCIHVQYM